MTTDSEQPEAKTRGRKGFGINFKVSAKGAVSVYGLGRFPVTLYREQWVRLLERTDDLKAFMEEHADELAKKGETPAAEEPKPEETAPPAATIEDTGAVDDPDLPPDDYDGLS
jgi:hypothetical protein